MTGVSSADPVFWVRGFLTESERKRPQTEKHGLRYPASAAVLG
jgi:hypothetical protein